MKFKLKFNSKSRTKLEYIKFYNNSVPRQITCLKFGQKSDYCSLNKSADVRAPGRRSNLRTELRQVDKLHKVLQIIKATLSANVRTIIRNDEQNAAENCHTSPVVF